MKNYFKISIVLSLLIFSGSVISQTDFRAQEIVPEEVLVEQIMTVISNWAGAWQSKLPDPYIAHYTLDYFPPKFDSRDEWLVDRRARLTEPAYIKIRLIDFELISMSGNEAISRFKLIYERPGYSDETYKELKLVNKNGFWLIEQEDNLEVIVL